MNNKNTVANKKEYLECSLEIPKPSVNHGYFNFMNNYFQQ